MTVLSTEGAVPEGIFLVAQSTEILTETYGSVPSARNAIRRESLVRPQDRDDYDAARMAARLLMAFVDNESLDKYLVVQHCELCLADHGCPEIPNRTGRKVSWAHHDGMVAAAVSANPVGIDLMCLGGPTFGLTSPTDALGPSAEDITAAEALVKTGAGTLDGMLERLIKHRATPFLDGNNRRVRLECRRIRGCVVSVATRFGARRVSLSDVLRTI